MMFYLWAIVQAKEQALLGFSPYPSTWFFGCFTGKIIVQ